MKKRVCSLLLVMALCLTIIPATAVSGSVTVVMKLGCNQMAVNDVVTAVDDQNAAVCPIAENNRTLVPVSRIVAAFGGKSTWEASTNATTFTLNDKTVKHTIGTNTVTTPQGEKTMEVASKAMNNRTYVPVRYVLEGLGLKVGYEPKNQLVVVSTHALDADNLLALPQAKTLLEALRQSGGGSVPPGGVLVSAAAPVESKSISKDSVSVQDPYNYMPKSMTFGNIDENDEGQQYRKFRGGKDAYDLIKGYVDALCATGNFTQTDDYYSSYKSTFFSYALSYTGTGRVSDDKLEMNFEDGVYGDVTIYGTIERSSCEGYIYIVKGLEFDDLGLRSTGETASTALPGKSLYTDLYRLSDGSYQTGDGRFHVGVGKAQVYRDGTAYTVPATLLRNQDKNREELHIDNFYRSDSILFTAPYSSLLTGDTFDTRSIGLNVDGGGYEEYATSMDSFLHWTFSNKLVGVCHDGDYLYCYQDGGNGFEQVAVRVMYWDAGRGEAVIYLCATFDSTPYEYEALAAVKMENAQEDTSSGSGSGSGDKDCWYCGGSGTCPTCNGTGTVKKWLPGTTHTHVDVNCTDCYSPGKCRICGGDGRG